jgi:hypothetical protein
MVRMIRQDVNFGECAGVVSNAYIACRPPIDMHVLNTCASRALGVATH